MGETWVGSLGWEDPLEEGMATHSSVLAWRISWTGKPGRLKSMALQRVGHNRATKHRATESYQKTLSDEVSAETFWQKVECGKQMQYMVIPSFTAALVAVQGSGKCINNGLFQFSCSVMSDSVMSATSWTVAHQASLSVTNSRSLLKLSSIESVMPPSHLILSSPSPPTFNLSQHQGLFK